MQVTINLTAQEESLLLDLLGYKTIIQTSEQVEVTPEIVEEVKDEAGVVIDTIVNPPTYANMNVDKPNPETPTQFLTNAFEREKQRYLDTAIDQVRAYTEAGIKDKIAAQMSEIKAAILNQGISAAESIIKGKI